MKLAIQNYLESSSIHGLAYTSKRYHIVERIFWTITLLASITITLTLIIQQGINMKKFPIIGYLSDKVVSVSEIHFPAVTICPDFLPNLPKIYEFFKSPNKLFRFEKHTMDKYYYEFPEFLEETVDERRLNLTYVEILNKIDSGKVNFGDLGPKILLRLQVVDTMLNLGVFAKTNITFPQDDFLYTLNEFEKASVQLHSKICFNFNNEYMKYISEVLTPLGLCYSFNIALADDLLNLNLTSDYFDYKIFLACLLSYKNNNRETLIIPRNETTYPLGLNLFWEYIFVNDDYKKNLTGHYFYLHDPYELPSSSSKKIKINLNRDGYIRIVPQLYQIDESLVDYDPKDRNCYLETERELKFYKKYTKTNCIQECLTDFMISRCGCIEFFMIRNTTTRICSPNEKNCTESANKDFNYHQQHCECLDPCNYVKYQFETVEKLLLPKNKEFHYMIAKVEFDNSLYNPFVRKQHFEIVDFLSYFGGLLGLFAGVSVISVFEVVFRITISLCRLNSSINCKCSRSTSKVIEESPSFEWKISKFEYYIKDIFNESSINGLNLVWTGSRLQRIIWTIIVVVSGFGCLIMIFETGQKIPNSQIIAFDDSMKSFGYIDFPAITFISIPIKNLSAPVNRLNLTHSLKIMHDKGIKIPEDKLMKMSRLWTQDCYLPAPRLFEQSNVSYSLAKYNYHSLQSTSRLDWFRQQKFSVNGRLQPVFAEIPTFRGLTYSFNLLDAGELYNLEMNIPESYYEKNVTSTNIENENRTKFVKNIKVGKGSITVFSLNYKEEPGVIECNANNFMIHDNDESPRLMEPIRWNMILYGFEMNIEAVPVIIRTDKSLQKLSPSDRECYFDGEKELKFYKKYSLRNCVAECYSNYSLNQCGCVDELFNPASADDYCDFKSVKRPTECLDQSKKDFYKLDIPSSLNCSCLPTCDSVTYHTYYSHRYSAESDEISINLRVNTEDAILFRRYQQFTFSDVVSYVGGLLGLFAGISVLSIVEIFYFFIIRVIVDGWRALRGHQ